jgi:S-adenosylmethionine decarboxylase
MVATNFPEPIKLTSLHEDETSSTQSENSDLCGGGGGGATCVDEVEEEFPNTFEGPEKNLEIDFKLHVGHPNGFREVTRMELDALCEAGQCQILSKSSNEHIDAYVLSESSLFIYKHKIVMKTCGTTTLLKCIPFIKKYADALEMEIEWVSYSRKNYTFPEEQIYPHTSFQTEVYYLNSFFPDGDAHVLGPLTRDHWYIYVWDAESHLDIPVLLDQSNASPRESTLHVLMQDMHPAVAKKFFKNSDPTMTSRRMTIESGIRDLVPGSIIDDFAFDPCGYSMNGILFDAYYTIHITPESHCSYVSFETNARLRCYESLLKNVLRVFRPSKYTVSIYADKEALEKSKSNIFAADMMNIDDHTYKRRGGHTQATFEGDYLCLMANWSLSNEIRPQTIRCAKYRSPSFA